MSTVPLPRRLPRNREGRLGSALVTGPRTRLLAALLTAVGLVAGGFEAHLAPQAEGWWHGVTGGPSGARVVGSVLAAALVWFAGGFVNVRPFLWMGIGVLPFIPALTGVLAPALFFSGFTMILVFAILAGVALHGLLQRFGPGHPATAALIALVFFILVGQYLPGPAGPQGDEPHYLLIAESLIRDGDVDLKNQFDARAFSKFTSADLEPHTAPRSPAGKLYAIHTPGLSAMVAPGYAVAGFAGARAVVSLAMAVVVGLLFLSARFLFDLPTANVVFAIATFASPLPVYANSVFPDSVATLPVAATLACLVSPSRWLPVLASATIAALPWLHPRFLPLGLVLAVALTFRGPFSIPRVTGVWVPLLLSTGALLLHFHSLFGSASLSAAYGPGFSSDVSILRIPWGASALLFDRQFGLLLFSPVLLIGLAGSRSLWKENRRAGATAIACFAALLGVGGAFSMWWGGASAPTRFLIGATPALLIFCGALWHASAPTAGIRAVLGAGLGYGSGLLLLACLAPRALHNRADGDSGLLRLLAPMLDVDRFFPGFVIGEGAILLAIAWGIALVATVLRPRLGLPALIVPVVIGGLAATRPLVDPFAAPLRVLESWNNARRSFGGVDLPSAFNLPVPLGAASWNLRPGSEVHSPRFSLPSGSWTLDVESRSRASEGAVNLARVLLIGDDPGAPFATATVRTGEPVARIDFSLERGERRLRLRGEGVQSEATVLAVRLIPRPPQTQNRRP